MLPFSKAHRWAENTEISAPYPGAAVPEVNHLPRTKSFWRFHFRQTERSVTELFFSPLRLRGCLNTPPSATLTN